MYLSELSYFQAKTGEEKLSQSSFFALMLPIYVDST